MTTDLKLTTHRKEYRKIHKAEKQAYDCEYRRKNKELLKVKDREKYLRNKDRILERAKRYRQKNRDKIVQYLREYWEANRGELNVKQREYYRKNRLRLIDASHRTHRELVPYDTYADRLTVDEASKADKLGLLLVKCAYCGKYFYPTRGEIRNRILALEGRGTGECRLYCSKGCKQSCPIFNKQQWPGKSRPGTSREVMPQLRQLVFERDGWACQLCGSDDILHCHHFTGIAQDPLGSADTDNCITACKGCHKQIHSRKGCRNIDLQCKKAA